MYNASVKILLPPSETKAPGGAGATLDSSTLVFPELSSARTKLIDELVKLCLKPKTAMRVLDLGGRLAREIDRNASLHITPTMPAIERYVGVLFDALSIRSMTNAQRRRADSRLMVGSALFGVLEATDAIPAYRLSAGSKIPKIGVLRNHWKPHLQPVLEDLAASELLVDLRSGAYQSLAPARGAVTARVLSEKPSGARRVVSHANKHTKGLLARALATTTAQCNDVNDIARIATRAGLRVEVLGETHFDVIVPG